MQEMTVKITWDGSLGQHWMNLDNLKTLLFTSDHTKDSLIEVVQVDDSVATGVDSA